MDQENNQTENQSPVENPFEPIMEKNIDSILDQLPDVSTGEDKGSIDSKAAEKLEQIEHKLQRKYTLNSGES